MFEHFTFGAEAQPRYLQDEVAASPTDITFVGSDRRLASSFPTEYPFPEQVPAINDIVARFTNYTLRPEDCNSSNDSMTQFRSCTDTTTESSPTFDFEDMSFVSTRRGLKHVVRGSPVSDPSVTSHPFMSSTACTPSGDDAGCRRLQRQLNMQLQSCKNHVKDINTLVETMISTNSQCRLRTPSRTRSNGQSSSADSIEVIAASPSNDLVTDDVVFGDEDDSAIVAEQEVSPHEDEGFAEMDDEEGDIELSLRRASIPRGIRKHSGAIPQMGSKYKNMSDSAIAVGSMNMYMPREKRKIRCAPRMRRRHRGRNVAGVSEE